MKLSERVARLAPSATLVMASKTKELQNKGVQIISLAAGEPNFSPPPEVIAASHAALDAGVNHYTPVRGTDELVAVMIDKFARDQQLKFNKDEVIATVGSKAALSLALDAMLDPGDEVIIFAPYWATYPELVTLSGGVPVIVQCSEENGFAPRIEDFEAALSPRTKAVMLNSPNNPSGAVYNFQTIADIMAILEKTEAWVISDEIYEHLVFGNHEHISPATISEDAYARTLVISGVAKSFAMTGWRVGVVGGPKILIDALVKLQSQRYTCVTSIAQSAAACALSGSPSILLAVERMRQAYEKRAQLLIEKISSASRPISCSAPQGAFYTLLDVQNMIGHTHKGKLIENDLDIAYRLLSEAHVSVVAGSPFGAPGKLRISLAASDENINQGLDRIIEWLC